MVRDLRTGRAPETNGPATLAREPFLAGLDSLPGVLSGLRKAAVAEAATYLVLLAAVFNHRVLGGVDLVTPAGAFHGVVFLVYLALVLRVRAERAWPLAEVVTLLAAAFVPLGTIAAERRLAALDRRPARR